MSDCFDRRRPDRDEAAPAVNEWSRQGLLYGDCVETGEGEEGRHDQNVCPSRFLLFLHLKVDADLEKFFRGKIHDGNAGAFFNAPDGVAQIIP